MDSNTIGRVIEDHFKEDPDVLEVALYALSTLTVNDAIVRGMMNENDELRGIPAKSYKLMKDFDNGLTTNKFWLAHWQFIKFQLAMDDIKLTSMKHYIKHGELRNDINAFKQARAILMARCDVLTTVAFLWKGIQFAEQFDSRFRIAVQLMPEHEQYFKEKGI